MSEKGNVFPQIPATNVNVAKTNREKRYCFQFPVMMKYLKKKAEGWSIADFLRGIGAKRVVLYAVSDFTGIVIKDIVNCKEPVEIVCVCDRNSEAYAGGYESCKVVNPDEMLDMYENKRIDKILVCSIMHEKNIFEDLTGRGISLDDLISINAAIYREV
ncbi:MAG: hypothetical protein E7289_08975 [Lachnospiraceae bacterium]|nr:hypothetical protein [Lachnospiraceae bacterium]